MKLSHNDDDGRTFCIAVHRNQRNQEEDGDDDDISLIIVIVEKKKFWISEAVTYVRTTVLEELHT